jgi:hypothetical protein
MNAAPPGASTDHMAPAKTTANIDALATQKATLATPVTMSSNELMWPMAVAISSKKLFTAGSLQGSGRATHSRRLVASVDRAAGRAE